MFVEGEVEIHVKDATAVLRDDHDKKLWLQGAFKDMSCYRISGLADVAQRKFKATVALKLADRPPEERDAILRSRNNPMELRRFMERMFIGKGAIKCVSDPKIKEN
jgi:hypothetical protein